MKNWTYLCILIGILFSCTSPLDQKEKEIEKIKDETKFALFHKALFSATANEMLSVKKEHPYMFPENMADSLVFNRVKDTIQQDIFKEVSDVYGDFTSQKTEIKSLFKHIKYYYPNFVFPIVVTDLTGLSYQNRVLYANNLLLISLDMYLGEEHEFYRGFPEYLAATFTPKHLASQVAKKIIETKYRINRDRTFLGMMVFEGKKLYLQDLFLPKVPDEVKLGYSTKELKWVRNNEASVWSYFIKKELLYSNNPKLKKRFIDEAPFSKFYISIDKETPGAIAKYIGLQIVRAYVDNNKITPQELMHLDAQTVLSQSSFKPRK